MQGHLRGYTVKKEQSNPLFGLHGVHPSLCVPSAYSTIDSHSDKSLQKPAWISGSLSIRSTLLMRVYFCGLSCDSFCSNPPPVLHSCFLPSYSIETEECVWLTFPSKPFFRFRRHEGTRLLEEDLKVLCVCLFHASLSLIIEGCCGLCSRTSFVHNTCFKLVFVTFLLLYCPEHEPCLLWLTLHKEPPAGQTHLSGDLNIYHMGYQKHLIQTFTIPKTLEMEYLTFNIEICCLDKAVHEIRCGH